MSRRPSLELLGALVFVLSAAAVGCANDGWADDDSLDGDDPPASTSSELSKRARWQPPASNLKGSYEGAGPYNGGKGCSGGLKKGTRAVGDLVDKKFPSIRYEGYSCRPNTANTSQLSVHGTGRALDIFASSSVGDQVANHLVNNAQALGVQLVIWNRTIWSVKSSGATSRQYTGPNPHTDHVHAEVTSATAKNGPNAAAADTDDKATDDTGADEPETNNNAPASNAGGGEACANDGMCNPGNDGSGLICVNRVCTPGCRSDAQCPGMLVCKSGQCQ